jgi:hypothetical protein
MHIEVWPQNNTVVDGIVDVVIHVYESMPATGSFVSEVDKIECFVEGSLIGSASATMATFTFDSDQYGFDYNINIEARITKTDGTTVSEFRSVWTEEEVIPDTTPPTITIKNPVNGTKYRKSVNISADFFDDAGLAEISMSVDGGSIYQWVNPSPQENGEQKSVSVEFESKGKAKSRALTVSATDTSGNSAGKTINFTI